MKTEHLTGLVLNGIVLLAASLSPIGAQEQDVERLTEWPALDKDQAKTVKTDVSRLRKARTEEMGDQAHAALVAVGAGCAPELIAALGKEKDEAAQDRIVAVLDLVTDAAHTRLLAASFDDKSPAVRTWSLERVALFPDPGTRAAADAALARIEKDKGEKKGPDEREVLAGALAATSAGSIAGLPTLFERAVDDWGKVGRNIRIACEGVRGEEASELALGYLGGTEDRARRVAAIRLLSGCGTEKSAVPQLRPLLDSDDSTLRIAAINALRGIVDGDMPLEKLSVFDSIEQAKTWKQRTG